ncbi:hypothetical protein R3P38DRAFT_2805873 [Favolaschia claudopus]|uniref:Uncharacterized protein n=1 Tax=Favolaschia claudopus TaxID=2862362 RepID=A0AAV9ZLQ9_9AGAR
MDAAPSRPGRPVTKFRFLRHSLGMPVRSKTIRVLADRLIKRSGELIKEEAENKVYRGEITAQQATEQAFSSSGHDAESEDPPSPATLMQEVFNAPLTPIPPSPGTLMYELFDAPLTPLPGELPLPEPFVPDIAVLSESRCVSPAFGGDYVYAPPSPLPGELPLPEPFISDMDAPSIPSRPVSPAFGGDYVMDSARPDSPAFGDDYVMDPSSPASDSDNSSYLFHSDPGAPQPQNSQNSAAFAQLPSDELEIEMDAVEQIALASADTSFDMEEEVDQLASDSSSSGTPSGKKQQPMKPYIARIAIVVA